MKLLAVWKGWLEGCIAGLLVWVGASNAGTPPDVVINTVEEALAFEDAAPFVFDGQWLEVHNSFSTDRNMELRWDAPITVGGGTHFEIRGDLTTTLTGGKTYVEKLGLGSLKLAGDNRHRGDTVLREGELIIGSDHALGEPLNNLDQMAGTRVVLEDGVRLPQPVVLRGADGMTEALPGMADVVEWRVQAGEAQLLNLVNAHTAMRKVGEGDLRLTQRYYGPGEAQVQVHQGGLIVEKSVSTPVIIDSGARLESAGSGIATVSRATVRERGMIAPGGRDDVGTLSISENMVFEPGGIFHVNAYEDGRADRIHADGEAQLAGLVQVEAGAGDWASEQDYIILSAAKGLGGTTFDDVTANFAFLTPSLSYAEDAVLLSLLRNDVGAGDVADPDDKDVGDIIDPPEDRKPPRRPRPPRPTRPSQPELPPVEDPGTDRPGNEKPVIQEPDPDEPEDELPHIEEPVPDDPDVDDPIVEQPVDEPPINEDSGNEDTSTEEPATEEPATEEPITEQPVIEDPVAEAPRPSERDPNPSTSPDRATPLTPLQRAIVGMNPEQARDALKQFAGSWHASLRSFLVEDSRYVREAMLEANAGFVADEPRGWGHAFGATGKRSAEHGIPGDHHHTNGVILGLDAPVSHHWRVGGVAAVQQARLKRDGRAASASVDSVQVGMTAGRQWDAWRFTAGLLHAWHRVGSKRRVTAGPLRDILNASYTARSLQIFFEVAPQLRALGDWAERYRQGWGPYLQQAWIQVKTPGFEESGGPAAHQVERASLAAHASTLGWRFGTQRTWRGRPIRLDADIAWRHVWNSTRATSVQRFRGLAELPDHTFSQASSPFESAGISMLRDGAALGVQAGIQLQKNAVLATRYSGVYGRGYRDHAGWVEFRWAF